MESLLNMERLKNITHSVVNSSFENQTLNAGINKAQNWWKNHQNHNISLPIVQDISPSSSRVDHHSGQLIVTILCAEDLYESRLSMFTASTPVLERPYVIIECNHQRFQTKQADSISTNQNPQWTDDNGPFYFDRINPDIDHLTIWIQQKDTLHIRKHKQTKTLGMCEVDIRNLIDQEQIWLPLKKDNKPVGQILLQIAYISKEK
ncbi:unnamed protein product [Adineta steineri]|uniref:C2 domain-containing protein n=1 Tax=Adineta steineri TaxID=433720 RepID=A0A815J8X1_9BILA|nr:unnamed protein product [Adineta steineri]CAF1605235.1 unnamed protein product [Adineta steineri]